MRYYLIRYSLLTIVIVTVCSFKVMGQDSLYVIKVKKPTSTLFVSHTDSFLIKGKTYLFTLRIENGKKRITHVLSDSIYISKIGVNQYVVKVARNARISKGIIRVHVKNEDGTKALYELLSYNIIEPEMPEIFVGNIKADSVIDKRYLYDYAKLHAYYKGKPVRILSFNFCTVKGGKMTTLSSENSSLTVAMKQLVQRLNPGSVIFFKEVVCLLPDGTTETVKSIRLFFDETNKYKVGERIIYKY